MVRKTAEKLKPLIKPIHIPFSAIPNETPQGSPADAQYPVSDKNKKGRNIYVFNTLNSPALVACIASGIWKAAANSNKAAAILITFSSWLKSSGNCCLNNANSTQQTAPYTKANRIVLLPITDILCQLVLPNA